MSSSSESHLSNEDQLSRLQIIQRMYDTRAPHYDKEGGFHAVQHADYIKWMHLEPGMRVLDLACGTGGITIPAAKIIGPYGQAVGVDISGASLEIAWRKADIEGLDVEFYQYDITNVHKMPGIEQGSFDVITCAAAFVLLGDGPTAVQNWTKLLKPGGRVIFDVLTEDSLAPSYIMDAVGEAFEVKTISQRRKYGKPEQVNRLMTDAGLNTEQSFMTIPYELPDIDASDSGSIYDKMTARKGWADGWYSEFRDHPAASFARAMFCAKLSMLADAEGKVHDKMMFYMAVGVKKIGSSGSEYE